MKTPKPKQKERTVKAWAVIWKEKSAQLYGVEAPDLLCEIGDEEMTRVKCKCHPRHWHYIGVFTIFPTRKEANAWRRKSKDLRTVPIILTYKLPPQMKEK